MVTDKDILPDVGKHSEYAVGHNYYEARFTDDCKLKIFTVFESGAGPHTVTLSLAQWDRLVAWVEWRRKDRDLKL
jgi:hypothetical protein